MRVCSKCNESKPESCFYSDKRRTDKTMTTCKVCHNKICRSWAIKNRNKANAATRRYYRTHSKEICNESARKRSRDWYACNREYANECKREWRKSNPEKVKAEARRQWIRIRSDLNKRLRHLLRCGISRAVRGEVKAGRTMDLLGCSIESFKIYIESLFEVGMSWENYGEWHIDHIIPCALFDMTKPEHQKRCFHVSNLQPLWGIDNISKGSKVTNPQLRLL